VNNAAEVDAVSQHLDAAGAPKEMLIWAMIETPAAIFNAREIASHPRVAVLVMGTNDLVKELRAVQVPGRAPVLPHLATALLAAREAGKPILDGVYNDIKNAEGFVAECTQGMQMGFDGKTLIHPDQVTVANDVWAPSEAEIEHSRKVIDAFNAARAEGKGVVQLDGKMIENLHVANAERILAVAEAIAELA
jgi:citrate lyase subunit beta/citryl-CoA lyase